MQQPISTPGIPLHRRSFNIIDTSDTVNFASGHGLVMKIGDFGMSRQLITRRDGDSACLERALSANVIGTAQYAAPELQMADSPVKQRTVDADTALKVDVSPHDLVQPANSFSTCCHMVWRFSFYCAVKTVSCCLFLLAVQLFSCGQTTSQGTLPPCLPCDYHLCAGLSIAIVCSAACPQSPSLHAAYCRCAKWSHHMF